MNYIIFIVRMDAHYVSCVLLSNHAFTTSTAHIVALACDVGGQI